MADQLVLVNQGLAYKRLRDMEDGSHAEVVWAEPTTEGGVIPVCDTWRIAGITESLWVPETYQCHIEFPVPTGQEWHILYVSVNVATVQLQEGDRYVQVLVTEDEIIQSYLATSWVMVPDGTEQQVFLFAAGCADHFAPNQCYPVQTPLPNGTMLYAGQSLLVRFCYNCNIGDWMRVHLQYAWREV